ncbi:hypothetical protein [Streptomyces flavofungini]|uniref:hypothetical protein n=1 Tax=Streptomyces flavofungini TaxID=68200 RepID=UPI0025B0A823|nr:hypothetical protein [Streptomyces flavofungini]WJV49902.1 hypothetical protein QUY26_32895 [Streptomyces flavofungini]
MDNAEASEGRDCLDRGNEGHTCQGAVTGRPSHAGTGTIIWRCQAGHQAAAEHARQVQERYPDSSTPASWFDPTFAGERWNEDD